MNDTTGYLDSLAKEQQEAVLEERKLNLIEFQEFVKKCWEERDPQEGVTCEALKDTLRGLADGLLAIALATSAETKGDKN